MSRSSLSSPVALPINTKPYLNVNIQWKEEPENSFRNLKAYFKNYLIDKSEAVYRIFGTKEEAILNMIEMVIIGGYAAEPSEKSIFIFFKRCGSESEVHIQGFGAVRDVIRDRDWLYCHLKKAKTKYKIIHESLRPGKSTFEPRGILSFFKKDILSFLSSSILLFVIASIDYIQSGELTQTGLSNLCAAFIVFIFWLLGTFIVYLRKRKTYVLELPKG